MSLLNAQDKKVVDKWFEIFAYNKRYSDRDFIQKSVELMSQQVNSELGYRQEIENRSREPESTLKINHLPTLFDLIKQRLAGGQQRKLEEILKSIKRETPDGQFSVYTQPIEAMMKRKDVDKARVLRKHGIHYSQTSRLCKLAQ